MALLRVVLDTNILISALMIQAGNPAAIYRAWQEGRFTLLTCAEHLDELRATQAVDRRARWRSSKGRGRYGIMGILVPISEKAACTPRSLDPAGFNQKAVIPFGCSVKNIQAAMQEFIAFLGFINGQMNTRELPRLEAMLMTANFSSIVGEFMSSTIPKHCKNVVKNRYHNGHPDLIPARRFENDMCQHGSEGIEIKGSRYLKAWQGHNPEDTWLMVFVFDSNRPVDEGKGIGPKPFSFRMVAGAEIKKVDWRFAGRSATSRRTITASITTSGFEKMVANWIYRDAALRADAPIQVEE